MNIKTSSACLFKVELSFRTGDIITVFGEMDDDGFYMAELRGQRGLVPRYVYKIQLFVIDINYFIIFFTLTFRSNFLTEAPGQYTGQVQMAGGVPGRPGQTMAPGQIPQQGGRTSK